MTAASAEWQINAETILVAGLVYYPTREFRQFDGQAMTRTGVYRGVPIYADPTLETYSVVYVPVGRDRMRTYERKRDHELAGTTGSRAPSFPVESPSAPAIADRVVGTSGSIVPVPAREFETVALRERPRRTRIESIPAPRATNGIWLPFDGRRWYSAGAASLFSPDRFTPVGEYHGSPVYRDRTSSRDEIWVAAVKGGLLAPYTSR